MLRLKNRLNCSTALRLAPALAVIGGPLLLATPALANCTAAGGVVTCAAPGGQQTATVGLGKTDNNVTVVVEDGAAINVTGGTPRNAISLGDYAHITVKSGGQVLNNTGGSSSGRFGTGPNTIEINQNGTILIEAGASVIKTGTVSNGEAINVHGAGNRITNHGIIQTSNSATIWFEDQIKVGPKNIVDNYGSIIQMEGGNVIGTSGGAGIQFFNQTGGRVQGNLQFAGGDDELFLYANSLITGNIDGGIGNNSLTLQGAAGSSDVLAGHVKNFSTLTKDGEGIWTMSGSLQGFTVVTVKNGTLALTGNNTGYTGSAIVESSGILEARAQSLPVKPSLAANVNNIQNDGILRFTQPAGDDGSYIGQITDAGVVEKTGGGMVTLLPVADAGNTYSGGTVIKDGVLAANADNAIGAAAGGITLDGGAFGFASSFTLGAGRPVTVTSNNGGLYAGAGVTGIITQGITGPGALTKSGDGVVTLTGANAYAGGTAITGGTLQLGDGGTSGSITGNVANNGTLAFNRADTVTFAGVISGSGNVRQIGAGTTILTANNSYTGETFVTSGALAIGDAANPGAALSGGGQVNVAAGALFGGYGSVAGDVVNDGAIHVADAFPGFAGGPGGNFTIGGKLTNAGHVQIGGAAVGNNLVVGSYVGLNGSIGINTVLGGDNSPSDRLVVRGGPATGASILQVTNAGGGGAVTWGNGIQVISALDGATTAAGAFTLARPVVAGPYEYSLFRGTRDASDPQSWYLRTDLPLTPITPIVPPQPNPGPTPEPTPTPPAPQPNAQMPNYRPETSLYAALPSMALGYGQSILGTLHERVGEQELLRGRQSANGSSIANGVWGRLIGQHVNQSASAGGIYHSGPAYDQNIAAFQIGLDLYRREHASGSRDHAGVYFAVGQSEGDVRHFTGARAGQNRFDAQTIGAYWTHYGAQGWYVDAVAQGTWYNAKANSTRMMQLSTDGFGVALSLETGYPLQLGAGWIIEPQAQLVYQTISLDNSGDAAANVRFSDVKSLAARVGARLSRTWTLDGETGPRKINVWARANLWNEFAGKPRTWFSSANGYVPFRSDMNGAWTQLGGGVTAQLNDNVAVYADASYNIGQGSDRRSWDGKLGLRVNW